MISCDGCRATCDVEVCSCGEEGSIPNTMRRRTLHPFPCEGCYTYEGETDNGGKPHGQGVMIWPKLAVDVGKSYQYRGQFVEGRAHGHGQYKHAYGSTYDGQWVRGKAEGYGEHVDEDYVTYRGQWHQNRQHGYGEEAWGDSGQRFEGEYEMGVKHGAGRFTWSKGEVYQGQFAGEEFDGIGSYFWPDGRSFTGAWVRGEMEGKGLYTWPAVCSARSPINGQRKWYIGDYSNNKKHGEGIYHFADGREYKGEWSKGAQCGEGEYVTYLGIKISGQWQRGDARPKEWKERDPTDPPDKDSYSYASPTGSD